MKSLNHIFRTIWSEALGVWIAVSEITRSRGKRSISGCIRTGHINGIEGSDFIARLKPLLIALACCFAINAQANPTGGVVVNGQASFNTSGNTLTVTNTPGTIINWQGFSIDANQVTHFAQQSAASAVLNRVVTNNPSVILGTLSSNGRVYLVNPGGIVFGAGSTVDVAGLVATSLNLSDADFLAGRHNFAAVAGAQNISNAGNITAQQGGEIFLIAPNVENSGIITAPNGEILLAAGHEVQLVNSLDPNLRVSITAPAGDATNLGQLVVQSGSLGLFGAVVRNTGTVSADSATLQGGKIVFKASQRVEAGGMVSANGTSGGSVNIAADHSADANAPGVVIHTGSIQAQGTAGTGGTVNLGGDNILSAAAISVDGTVAGGKIGVLAGNRAISTAAAQYTANSTQGQGGDILVSANVSNYTSGSYSATGATGGNITLAGNEIKLAGTQLDASGTNGGGNVRVGGLMHGAAGFGAQGISLSNSTNVLTNSSTSIRADALQSGNGGEVVLWSDQSMRFRGAVSARGGAFGGDGGNAEISGLTSLGYGGLVDLSANSGANGTLLLDPKNLTIVAGAGTLPGTSIPTILELLDPTPGAAEGFGGSMIELSNGNIVIASPNDSFGATSAGAVYMYSSAGTLLTTLTGTTANDQIGSGGIRVVGSTNNNFVVVSPWWDSTVGPVVDVGAVTWVSGATGLAGSVSGTNSLVGSTASDQVGYGNYGTDGITVLSNGNYVVSSPRWNNGAATWAGAVTWGDGAAGTVGAVTSANSLVGSLAFDTVGGGNILGSFGNGVVTALTNGNYVVTSPMWGGGTGNGNGAATWGDGSTAGARLVGTITLANSLIGIGATDNVGNGGVTVLNNGNYVVRSNVYGSYAFQGGAVTWGNGLGGTVGNVTNVNSLVGQSSGDMIGKTVTALTNGNYVVASPYFGATDVGAVTWGNGLGGTTSWVTSANSLVGTNASDQVGGGNTYVGGVTALSNGNYVVGSPNWHNGAVALAGAVTWGDGATTGVRLIGPISSANSFLGTAMYDLLGSSGTVTALTGNGNYVIAYQAWNANRGASVWVNGTTGKASDGTYVVSAANSLVGLNAGDYVGMRNTALSNGNYVVTSPYWNNAGAAYAGAATWADGTTGVVGNVTAANSLVGTQVNDYVGSGGVTALSNGNYVVNSYQWNNGTATSAGAVTWGNGATAGARLFGAVSTANSLVGSTASDQVGATGIIELGNGSYVVSSYLWNNGAATGAGAVTWSDAFGTTVGAVGSNNSLVGSTLNENLGFVVVSLKGTANIGSAYVGSSAATNAGLAGAGRAYILGATNIVSAATSSYFTDTPGSDIVVGADYISATLNLGTNMVLQANNDITQNLGANILSLPTGPGGNLTMQAGRSVILNGAINMKGNLTVIANDAGANASYRSAGTAVLNASTATLAANQMTFVNSGSYIALNNITAGGPTIADAATVITLTGANSFTNLDLRANGGSSGTGALYINDATGTTSISGTLLASGLDLLGGSLSLGSTATTLGGMSLSNNGTITDNAGLTVTGTFFWNSGTITGTGVLATGPGSTTTFAGNATLTDKVWQNAGTVNINGAGSLLLDGSGTQATIFTNQAGGIVNLNGTSTTPIQWATTPFQKFFANQGTLNKNSGSTTVQTLNPTLINTGTVNVLSGTLAAPTLNVGTNSGIISVAAGTTFSTGSFTNVNFWSGSAWIIGALEGSGTIDVGAGGTITNNGIIAPGMASGDRTGMLTINGNLVSSVGLGVGNSGPQLNLDLDSTAAGNFDVLHVTGTADITSTIVNLQGLGAAGNYPALTAATLLGNAATVNSALYTQTETYDTAGAPNSLTFKIAGNAQNGGAGTSLTTALVHEITQISLQSSPKEQTATTVAEEEKRHVQQLLNEAETSIDIGGIFEPLPVCRQW